MTLSSFSTYRFLHLGELVSFLQKTSFYWELVFTHEKGFSSPFSGGQSDLVYNDDKNHQVTTLTLYQYSQSPTCSLPVYNCSRAKPRLPSPSIYFWFALNINLCDRMTKNPCPTTCYCLYEQWAYRLSQSTNPWNIGCSYLYNKNGHGTWDCPMFLDRFYHISNYSRYFKGLWITL